MAIEMKEINIQSVGLEITEDIRKHIAKSLHCIFGFNKYKVYKIIIKLIDQDNVVNYSNISCCIQIYIKDQPVIKTKLNTLDIFSAITLAMERSKLKVDHGLNTKNDMDQQMILNEKSIRYGSYKTYQ